MERRDRKVQQVRISDRMPNPRRVRGMTDQELAALKERLSQPSRSGGRGGHEGRQVLSEIDQELKRRKRRV